MAKQWWTSSRVIAGIAGLAVVATIVLLLALPSCSKEESPGSYTAEDIGGFQPADGMFTYSDPIAIGAGEAWQTSWPDMTASEFDPPECLAFLAASETLLASDESETAEDGLAFLQGALPDQGVDPEAYEAVYIKMRTLSSESAASDYVNNFEAMAGPCASGYSYTSEDLVWSVGSVTVSTTALDGAGDILVIDERSLGVEVSGELVDSFEHYTHYVYSHGNALIIASYLIANGSASNEDAADLIGQFIDYLG